MGSEITVKATPESGYLFDGWLDEKTNTVIFEESLEIQVDEPYKLTAQFTKENTGIPSNPLISLSIGLILVIYTRARVKG